VSRAMLRNIRIYKRLSDGVLGVLKGVGHVCFEISKKLTASVFRDGT
jgi:hypothetical protein